MKHSGKATKAALKVIWWTLVLLLAILSVGILATLLATLITTLAAALVGLWVVFALFTIFFFRDPTPRVPMGENRIVAPAHGKIDVIDQTKEQEFMGGRCQRVSIFLSVLDVHVQKAPVAGRIALLRHTPGQFLNALKLESAAYNENILLGIESSERPGEKIGVRLIAGLLARRIVSWVELGDNVARGERISLIQFGSRVDLYLPLSAKIQVKVGDRAVGGETVVAI